MCTICLLVEDVGNVRSELDMFKLRRTDQILGSNKRFVPRPTTVLSVLLFSGTIVVLFLFINSTFFVRSSSFESVERKVTRKKSQKSSSLRDTVAVNSSTSLILIDLQVLSCLGCRFPSRPVEFISFSPPGNASRNEVIYRAYDDSAKDFFTVEYGTETRALEKFKVVPFEVDGREFLVPDDIDRFQWSWRRSKFVDCLGLDMGRSVEEDFQPVASGIARFRSLAASYGVTLTLNGGSLLGWYRECSIIPHTTDMDFSINSEEHSPNFIRAVENSSDFQLYHVYSEPSGCFQFKACFGRTKLDVFYLYRNTTTAWICGSVDAFRVLWSYPPATDFCVGELLGTLVYVPCNVEEHLEVSYGKGWRKEVHSKDFGWASSGANILRKDSNGDKYTWTARYVDRCDGYV
ncbi:hypothetical protein QR680_016948 [Steinernema hermaphroditum]|uniref:PpiC domain-containing protein n=1 Tax=Steinernema hermaphroditum TaxID=289476 RepID=A0AA39LNG9_9BILA|nr:hypothetical protein QR680_016948 [Steinernema hermaphroditum]